MLKRVDFNKIFLEQRVGTSIDNALKGIKFEKIDKNRFSKHLLGAYDNPV